MENASKALLIAAAILVVIILIAVGMKIYSSTTDTQKVGINTGKTISDKTGEATDLAIEQISGKSIQFIDGNTGKKKSDIQKGDDILIGGTERFKVLYIDNGKGKAVSYYRLKLDANPIKQATKDDATTAGTCAFSTEAYWENDNSFVDSNGDIIMNDDRNIVQKYIKNYEMTLKSMGAKGVNVRIESLYEFDYDTSIGDTMRDPGGKAGEYWTCSKARFYIDKSVTYECVAIKLHGSRFQSSRGDHEKFDNSNSAGVRPIIEVDFNSL